MKLNRLNYILNIKEIVGNICNKIKYFRNNCSNLALDKLELNHIFLSNKILFIYLFTIVTLIRYFNLDLFCLLEVNERLKSVFE